MTESGLEKQWVFAFLASVLGNINVFVCIYSHFLTSFPSSSHVFLWCLRESWMAWICMETADNTASSKRLNSSKQPHAPHFTKPTKIRPIDLTSIPWKTKTDANQKKILSHVFSLSCFVCACVCGHKLNDQISAHVHTRHMCIAYVCCSQNKDH